MMLIVPGWILGAFSEQDGHPPESAYATVFVALGLLNDNVSATLQSAYTQHETLYEIKPREQGGIWIVLLQWLPMLLIIVLFLFFIVMLFFFITVRVSLTSKAYSSFCISILNTED